MFISFNSWFRMFKFSVVCARFFVRSFTYSEVFRPEDQNSFGSEAVSWRWLSMTIGGGVGGGDLLWGICALPGVPDLQVLLEPQLVAEDIYNICLKFKVKVWTDLKYMYFHLIQEQLEMRLLTRFFRSFGNSGLHGDEAPEEQTTIQKFWLNQLKKYTIK